MGGHPWFYFVEYNQDIDLALQKLRKREFEAGRYNPVMWFPPFPVSLNSPAPGAGHASMEEALEASEASGTRSILDMIRVSVEADLSCVSPFPEAALVNLFGTTKPTHEMIEECDAVFEELERGKGVYIIVYEEEHPKEIFFAGYSYD